MNIDLSEIKKGLPSGVKILCAVSGGADSMCMLDLLFRNREKLNIEVAAAHFEHGIRGEESLRDAEFVREYCLSRKIECVVEHANVPEYAKSHSMGMEETARRMRYGFLNRTAEKLGCSFIATAHNADDNVETVLFNLARGSGNAGLSGIPFQRDHIIRPLLRFTRKDIEEYLNQYHIPHVEDSTNSLDDYSRNRIRHKVMPVLREINPSLSENVLHSSELLRDDEEFIQSVVSEFIRKYYNNNSLPVSELRNQHRAVSSRVIRRLCPGNLSYEHVSSVLELCSAEGLAYADVPGSRIRKEQGRIYFSGSCPMRIPRTEIVPGRSVVIDEIGMVVSAELCTYEQTVHGLLNTYFIKYDEIKGILFCSSRQPGDKLRVYRRGCTKTLKQLFLEAGYTQQERDLAPVFRDDEGILTIPGLALSERAKPDPGDVAIKIDIYKIPEEK